MAFYKLYYDDELAEKQERIGKPFIYADDSNINEIEVNGIKKGYFEYELWEKNLPEIEWPEVILFYSSDESNRQVDYLDNLNDWPIVHSRVMNELEKHNIKGLSFYPVILKDISKGVTCEEYWVMYISNFIDAFDMDRSKYVHDEVYDMYTFLPRDTYMNIQNCEGYDIFRADKSLPNIYVSERFKNIIESNEFMGFRFKKQLQ